MTTAKASTSTQTQKPDSPTDLTKPAWKFTLKRSLHEFSDDQCTDLAAALTYYAVLSLFPAVLATISLLGLVGQGSQTADALVGIVNDLGQPAAADTVRTVMGSLAQSSGAGVGLILGLLSALWSASGYVGAFGRAMNRIYEIREGRPFWKLRPLQIVITLVAVALTGVVAVALVVSGPLADAVGRALGLGDSLITLWQFAKWPVLAAIVTLIIAVLYYATPNVKQPKFVWISSGAVVALVLWVVASLGFAFYVANFGSYNKTYGTLAGVIVFLLWLWITNLALLLGAEFNSELERARQLQAGIPAERDLQLPPRDDRGVKKKEAQERSDEQEGRAMREGSHT